MGRCARRRRRDESRFWVLEAGEASAQSTVDGEKAEERTVFLALELLHTIHLVLQTWAKPMKDGEHVVFISIVVPPTQKINFIGKKDPNNRPPQTIDTTNREVSE